MPRNTIPHAAALAALEAVLQDLDEVFLLNEDTRDYLHQRLEERTGGDNLTEVIACAGCRGPAVVLDLCDNWWCETCAETCLLCVRCGTEGDTRYRLPALLGGVEWVCGACCSGSEQKE